MKKRKFKVDAALLRELGERLIGRAHIALAELVKNSYDADAANCVIEFGSDQISISDDGHGMSQSEFLNLWMRIGATHKVEQQTSRDLGRPLTGSKGLGRLSVQFLADEMTLESTSEDDTARALYAFIDWRSAVHGKDLDTVNVEWEMRQEAPEYPGGHPTGTRITLTGLKSAWDAEALKDLGGEVWMLRSPFKRPGRRTESRRAEDFEVQIDAPDIEGAREAFDTSMKSLFTLWRARIRGTLDNGRRGEKASIVVEFRPGYPEGGLTP